MQNVPEVQSLASWVRLGPVCCLPVRSEGQGSASVPRVFSRLLVAMLTPPLPLFAAYIPGGCYDYMTMSASDHIRHLTPHVGTACSLSFRKAAHSHVAVSTPRSLPPCVEATLSCMDCSHACGSHAPHLSIWLGGQGPGEESELYVICSPRNPNSTPHQLPNAEYTLWRHP